VKSAGVGVLSIIKLKMYGETLKYIGPSLKNFEVYHDLTPAAVETVDFGVTSISA
jgi:hypothetical protein